MLKLRSRVSRSLPLAAIATTTGLALIAAPVAAASTIGTTSVGSSKAGFAANAKRVNQYSLPQKASLSKLSVYLAPTSTTGTQSLEGVVYADSSGSPGALLGRTSVLAFSGSNSAGWYDLTLSSPLALNAGKYWLGIATGNNKGVAGFSYSSVGGVRKLNNATFTSGPSNPFGTANTDSELMSLYGTYTAAATTGGAPANTALPSISGSAQIGSTLTASSGSWSGSPTSYTYSWQRCSSSCTPISGATGANYTVASVDTNDTLDVVVTATNSSGSASMTSFPSAQVGTVAVTSGAIVWTADAAGALNTEWASLDDPTLFGGTGTSTSGITLPTGRVSFDTTTKAPGSARSYKISVQTGDRDLYNPKTAQRTELAMGNPVRSTWTGLTNGSANVDRLFRQGEDRWIAWQVRLDPTWPITTQAFNLTNQFKQQGSFGSPILSLETSVRACPIIVGPCWTMERTTSDPANQWPSGFTSKIPLGPAIRGVWVKLVLHELFDPSASVGFVEWRGDLGDGLGMRELLPLQHESTQKISNGSVAGFPSGTAVPDQARIGIYRSSTLANDTSIWFDGFTVGTTCAAAEANAFGTVYPGCT